MKTKDKKVKNFDTVKTFQKIREKISKDIQGMTFEEMKSYIASKALQPKS